MILDGAMANVDALKITLDTLRDLGRIEKIDAARVEALRSMAGQLDADPSNAALWRQYREALRELTADDGDDSVDDAAAALYSQMGDSAPS